MVVPFLVAWFVYRNIPECSLFVSFIFVSDMRADTQVRPYRPFWILSECFKFCCVHGCPLFGGVFFAVVFLGVSVPIPPPAWAGTPPWGGFWGALVLRALIV